MMKLISWNVNARVKDASKQVKALSQQEPHVVALQDVRTSAVAQYEKAFAEMGLRHVIHTFLDTPDEATPTGVLIASCFELERLPLFPSSVLWPEGFQSPNPEKMMKHWVRRTLFVTVKSPWGKIDLYNAYITPGCHVENTLTGRIKYPYIKWDLLSGIYHAFAISTDRLRILCGDFNTPRKEKPTGEIITWGYGYDKKKGSYRLTRPDIDKFEWRVLRGLAVYNLPDVYRHFHGYQNCEKVCSWRTYRYDHIFASQALSAQSIAYLYTLHEHRLSDHVPIEAVFALKTVPQEVEVAHQ
jgi:exodeoxyribonuclease III